MKKYIIPSLSVFALVLGLGAIVALAENGSSDSNSNNTSVTTSTPSSTSSPMIVNIGPDGRVLLRGEVTAVNTDSVSVKSWGMDWKIKISSTTKISTVNKVLTDIVVGDLVGVAGNISEDGTFVIDATIIRKWGQMKDSDSDGIPDNQDTDHNNDGKPDMEDAMGHFRGAGAFMPILGGDGEHGGMMGGSQGDGGPKRPQNWQAPNPSTSTQNNPNQGGDN